jgi:uncharacterized phage protein gp47/JayE
MAITVPDRATVLAEILAHLKSLEPNLDVSQDTVPGAMVAALVELTYGIHANVKAAWNDIFPDSAMDTTTLERHAERVLGATPRKPATGSSGTDALRVTGTLAGAAVVAGDSLVHTDGTRYQLTEGATVGVGTADVSVEAISTGATTNKLTGDTMDFESPPANIETEATLVGNLSGGFDRETDAELLARVLVRIRNPPGGGRFADWLSWALEVVGISGAYVYGPSSADVEGRRGIGTVDVAIVTAGTGSARIPSTNDQTNVEDKLDEERPAGARDFSVLIPGQDDQDIDVRLDPDPGYEFDWSGSGVVSSYASKVITWTAALPASLMATFDAEGSVRIFVAGQLFTVDAYDNAGPYTTDIVETPTTNPASPDPIYPGGPLSAPALAALKTYVDSLGPARGTAADPNQTWDDTLRLSTIYAVLKHYIDGDGNESGVPGIKEVTIVTPASSYTPTDNKPAGTVDLVVYDEITVRPA